MGLGGEEAGDCALRGKAEMLTTASISPRTPKGPEGTGSLLGASFSNESSEMPVTTFIDRILLVLFESAGRWIETAGTERSLLAIFGPSGHQALQPVHSFRDSLMLSLRTAL